MARTLSALFISATGFPTSRTDRSMRSSSRSETFWAILGGLRRLVFGRDQLLNGVRNNAEAGNIKIDARWPPPLLGCPEGRWWKISGIFPSGVWSGSSGDLPWYPLPPAVPEPPATDRPRIFRPKTWPFSMAATDVSALWSPRVWITTSQSLPNWVAIPLAIFFKLSISDFLSITTSRFHRPFYLTSMIPQFPAKSILFLKIFQINQKNFQLFKKGSLPQLVEILFSFFLFFVKVVYFLHLISAFCTEDINFFYFFEKTELFRLIFT